MKKLEPFFEKVFLSANEYIYRVDDTVDFVYFPETAVVSESRILEDGQTTEIAMIGNEGALGILSLFCSGQAKSWTQVLIPGSAYRIDNLILKNQMISNQCLQNSVLCYTSEYIGQISQRAVYNSFHTLTQRFCRWLIMLRERGKSNEFPLIQEQIARLLGAHRPSLTVIAKELRQNGIIDYWRGQIVIINQLKLRRSA